MLPGLGAALIVFLCLVGKAWVAAGLITVVAVAGLWIYLWQRFEAMEKLRRQADTSLRAAKNESLAQLRQAGAELTDWTSQFRAADAKDAEVQQMFDMLRLAGNPPPPLISARSPIPTEDLGDRDTWPRTGPADKRALGPAVAGRPERAGDEPKYAEWSPVCRAGTRCLPARSSSSDRKRD